VLETFRDEEKRQSFYGFFLELEDLYEITSPDAFLREFMIDYERLADMYALLRAAYEGSELMDRELARKTAKLVQEYTKAGAIHGVMEIYEITPETLSKVTKSKQSNTVKIFNLVKSIERKVQIEAATAPYLFSIGELAEAIVEAFKQRQISTQEALKRLKELIRQINEAEKEQAQRGIIGEPFAIMWLLKQQGVPSDDAEKIATDMATNLQMYPHWKSSDKQARPVRRKLYQLLEGKMPAKEVPQVVKRIMSVIRRRGFEY